ncbi:hypothetical protein [Bosea sp. NPDC055594]
MPNAHVAAAATGLPSTTFNRRRMLLGLAAASSAAAVPAAAATRTPIEDPELIQLGDKTAALALTYQAAVAEREAIVAAWAPQWPAVPVEIRTRNEEGKVAYGLQGEWPEPHIAYNAPETLRRRAAAMREPRRFRKGTSPLTIAKDAVFMERAAAKVDALASLSELYCAERRRVWEASGIRPAQIKEGDARTDLIRHVAAIMERQPLTMAGAIVQAEALEVLSAVPPLQRSVPSLVSLLALPVWGEQLAANILRLARSAS